MAKLTTQPVDAIIGLLVAKFDTAVFNYGLTEATPANGMRGNILKADNFRNFKPHTHRTTAYYVVGMGSAGVRRNHGAYSHYHYRIPVYIEIHSTRSDNEAEAWKEEAIEILETYRKTISDYYSDYRYIELETSPIDVSAGAKFKWVINFGLRTHVESYG